MGEPAEELELPATRRDALAAGLTLYFTGKPCKHGHVAKRNTAKGDCTACHKVSQGKWHAKNPGKSAIYSRRWIAKQDGYHRAWYAENAEQRRAERRQYRQDNLELERQRDRERRAADIESARAKDRASNKKCQPRKNAWMRANRDKCREYERAYLAKNPHTAKAKNSRRRALVRQAEGIFTHDDVARIFAAQGGRCACCHRKSKLTVDHIVPLAKGGTNWPSNIQGLCPPCNSAKRDRDPIEFMQSMGALL